MSGNDPPAIGISKTLQYDKRETARKAVYSNKKTWMWLKYTDYKVSDI